jgi:hypothetical protein
MEAFLMFKALSKKSAFLFLFVSIIQNSTALAIDGDVEEVLLKNFVFDSMNKKFYSATIYNKNETCMIEFAYSSHTGDYMLSLHRFGKIGVGIDLRYLEMRGDSLVYVESESGGGSWKGSEIFLDSDGFIKGFKNSGSQYCNFEKKFPVTIE